MHSPHPFLFTDTPTRSNHAHPAGTFDPRSHQRRVLHRRRAERQGHSARLARGRALRARPRHHLRGPDGRAHPVRRGTIGARRRRCAPGPDRRRHPEPRARRPSGRFEAQGARRRHLRQRARRVGGAQLDDRRDRRGEERRGGHGRAARQLHRPQGRDDQGQADDGMPDDAVPTSSRRWPRRAWRRCRPAARARSRLRLPPRRWR